MIHSATKIIHVLYFTRSAMAPQINATVIMANAAWNATSMLTGYLLSFKPVAVNTPSLAIMESFSRKPLAGSPKIPPMDLPAYAIDQPQNTQTTMVTDRAAASMIIMFRTAFARTMPP